MPASTNIPISATTTDFQSALKAAAAAVGNFDRDLNTKLITSFRALDREDITFQQGLGRIQAILAQQAAQSKQHLDRISTSFQSAGKSLSTYLTAPLLLAGGAAFKAYADIDGMNRGLKVVAGSTEGANKQFKEFYALSQKPGLGLEQAVAAGLQLETLGFKAQTAKNYIAEIGNAIALGGKGKVEFGSVITQFTQMAGKAKVMGDDLKPIINASPVIAKAINDMFGTVDSEQISKKLQALGKTPKDFIASLVAELSKVERVGAGPLTALENFGDATKIAGFEFGKAADEAFGLTEKINSLGGILSNGATAFGETSTAVKVTTLSVLGAAAALGPLALTIGAAIKGYQAMTLETSALRVGLNALVSPTGLAIAAGLAVAAVGFAAYKASQPLVELVSKTQLLESVNRTAIQSISAERVELDKLYQTAIDETKSKAERAKAIKSLNQLSPDYLGFLNEENIKSTQAAEAIFKQGQAILFRGRARAAEDKITELSKKRFETEQRPTSDFEHFEVGVSPLTGMQQIVSPSEIRNRAQQYKNDALQAIDANLAELQNYVELNSRRAGRRGISLDVPVTPTFGFKGGGGDSAYDKLKSDVDTAEAKIKDFITKHGAKAKIPVELQIDFNNKSALLKAADDAVKTIKPKTYATASFVDTGNLAIAKRYASELETQIQNLGGKATEKQLQDLANIRSAIERTQALTGKNQQLNILGIQAIASTATNAKVAGIVDNITKLARVTPGLFANTSIGAFLTSTQQARPSLSFIQARIEEIKTTIAELSNAGESAESPKIKALITQLAQLKKALADATSVSSAADAKTNPGVEGDVAKKYIEAAEARIAAMRAQGKEVKQTAEEMAKDMEDAHDFLANKAVDVLSAVGEGLSQGANPLKTALKAVLSFLGDFMVRIGTAMIVGGTLLEGASDAFPFLKPLFGFKGIEGALAGGALVVGGATIKGLAGSYAKGGVFTQATPGWFGEYPSAGRDPEIATPQSIMRSTFEGVMQRQISSLGVINRPELSFNRNLNSRLSSLAFDRLQQASKPSHMEFNHKIQIEGKIRGTDIYTVLQRHEVTLDSFGV